ncbi:hypothetical protein SeMB42_g02132 [Synchytrium endobioticum]|uniref:Autophagy protein ATG5 UblB domain-containing protein n=1 Tax=Synchytrium endobioticum TaxID=286115 RepID=A0A507DHE9_9FUNG|nr:hypothetical protein SeLEV6574_g02354 [Synchytrium endobioticum]TPX50821.1 hypothetical protein SeMB42_g02132 [Synchytrium endobioticum]
MEEVCTPAQYRASSSMKHTYSEKSRTLEAALHGILRNDLETLDFQRMARLHGIRILPETPISYLSINLSYPDNFLHLVIFLHS